MNKKNDMITIYVYLCMYFMLFFCTNTTYSNDFSTLFNDINNYSRRTLLFTFEKDTQLYKKVIDNNLVELTKIKKGNKGILIANDLADDFANDLYLCKVIGDNGLWTGWIKASDIVQSINRKDRYDYLHTGDLNHWGFIISNNNDIIALATEDTKNPLICTLHLYTRYGKHIISISTETIKRTYPDVCQINPAGWSKNDSILWFTGLCDSIICIGQISLKLQHINLFSRPIDYISNAALDFNNGILYYSNFPEIFDTDDLDIIKKSGKKYSIYKQKLGSGNEEIVSNEVDNIFELFVIRNEKLEYIVKK